MTHIVAIVLILGLCLPQALLAGIILEADEVDRLKETTDTLSVKKENQSRRIVGKLTGGVLGGTLVGLAVGSAAEKAGDCTGTFCGLGNSLIGGWVGYLVGVPAGMSVFDPHDRFKYSLVGSLIGGAASLPLLYIEEDLWPALFIVPFVGAAIMSEFSRKPPEDRRVSVGLFPGPKGRLSAVVTLRF